MEDPHDKAAVRRGAYRTANRLLTSAGLALALAGIRPRAPEMEAIRRALRAVNVASGLEKPKATTKEVVRAFPAGNERQPRNAV